MADDFVLTWPGVRVRKYRLYIKDQTRGAEGPDFGVAYQKGRGQRWRYECDIPALSGACALKMRAFINGLRGGATPMMAMVPGYGDKEKPVEFEADGCGSVEFEADGCDTVSSVCDLTSTPGSLTGAVSRGSDVIHVSWSDGPVQPEIGRKIYIGQSPYGQLVDIVAINGAALTVKPAIRRDFPAGSGLALGWPQMRWVRDPDDQSMLVMDRFGKSQPVTLSFVEQVRREQIAIAKRPGGLSNDLMYAIREAQAARYVLFWLDHVDGEIALWSGRGDLEYAGKTWKGVWGLAEIKGVSGSSDLQNHQPELVLHGLTGLSLTDGDTKIRNREALLQAVWMRPDGSLYPDSLELFRGLGDYVITRSTENTVTLKAVLRAKMADWAQSTPSYWTKEDRVFADDTGFDHVAEIESKTVTGGGLDAEILDVFIRRVGDEIWTDEATPVKIVDELGGYPMWRAGCANNAPSLLTNDTASPCFGGSSTYPPVWAEEGTMNKLDYATDDGEYIHCAGEAVSVDSDGYVVSTAGNKFLRHDFFYNEASFNSGSFHDGHYLKKASS